MGVGDVSREGRARGAGRVGWAVPRWACTVALIQGGQGAGVPVGFRRRRRMGCEEQGVRRGTPRFDMSPKDFRAPLSLVLCVHSLRRHVLPQNSLHRFPPRKFLIDPIFYHPLFYHPLFFTPFCPRLCLPGPSAHQIRVRPHGPGQKRTYRVPTKSAWRTHPPILLVQPARLHRDFIPLTTHRPSTFCYLHSPPQGNLEMAEVDALCRMLYDTNELGDRTIIASHYSPRPAPSHVTARHHKPYVTFAFLQRATYRGSAASCIICPHHSPIHSFTLMPHSFADALVRHTPDFTRFRPISPRVLLALHPHSPPLSLQGSNQRYQAWM